MEPSKKPDFNVEGLFFRTLIAGCAISILLFARVGVDQAAAFCTGVMVGTGNFAALALMVNAFIDKKYSRVFLGFGIKGFLLLAFFLLVLPSFFTNILPLFAGLILFLIVTTLDGLGTVLTSKFKKQSLVNTSRTMTLVSEGESKDA